MLPCFALYLSPDPSAFLPFCPLAFLAALSGCHHLHAGSGLHRYSCKRMPIVTSEGKFSPPGGTWASERTLTSPRWTACWASRRQLCRNSGEHWPIPAFGPPRGTIYFAKKAEILNPETLRLMKYGGMSLAKSSGLWTKQVVNEDSVVTFACSN